MQISKGMAEIFQSEVCIQTVLNLGGEFHRVAMMAPTLLKKSIRRLY